MKKSDFDSIEPGTLLRVGDHFTEGDSEDWKPIEHLLNGVITFRERRNDWIYHEEDPETPFFITELVGVYTPEVLPGFEAASFESIVGLFS